MDNTRTRRWWITRVEWLVGLGATALTLVLGLWLLDETRDPMFGAGRFDPGWAGDLVYLIPMIAAVVGLVRMTRLHWPRDEARDWRYRVR
jgi:hypothetical protein